MSRTETRAETSSRNPARAVLRSIEPQRPNTQRHGRTTARSGGTPRPKQSSHSGHWRWLAPVLAGSAAALAALGAAVLYNRQKAGAAERKTPPIGRFLDVDGVRLHYIERGQGEPVVLIHGNGTMIQDFAVSGLVDRLASRHRVIVFDRPGYGYSSRPRQL